MLFLPWLGLLTAGELLRQRGWDHSFPLHTSREISENNKIVINAPWDFRASVQQHNISFSCFSALLTHWCVFAFEKYKWPFQIQHLRTRMTIDNNNIFHMTNIFHSEDSQIAFLNSRASLHPAPKWTYLQGGTKDPSMQGACTQQFRAGSQEFYVPLKAEGQVKLAESISWMRAWTKHHHQVQLRRESAMGSILTRKGQSPNLHVLIRARALC